MMIAGIDASINSTGIVLLGLNSACESFSVKYLGFTQVKKHESENILYYSKKDFSNYIEQNLWMREKIVEFCKDAKYIAIEDYSFASVGKVFHIAEFTGALKSRFYALGKKIRLYDPPTIKMFATKKGNADKIRMCDEFDNNSAWLTKPDLNFLIDSKRMSSKYDSPRSDIVDAYFIAKLLQLELSLKNKVLTLDNFHDKIEIERIFKRKTKGFPVPLIEREFIQFE